jgi:hypothetical protein
MSRMTVMERFSYLCGKVFKNLLDERVFYVESVRKILVMA